MKIAYFHYHHDLTGQTQGAAVQIQALAQELQHLGHEVAVQAWGAGAAGASQAPPQLKDIRWLRRYGHVPRLWLRNLSLFRRESAFLARYRPDVLLAVSSYGTISPVWSARRHGLPLVLFCEAPLAYEYLLFQTQYASYRWLGAWLEGYALRRARWVVCISEVLKGYLLHYGGPASKFRVIPNGADPTFFAPQPPDQALQQALDLADKTVLGFVGSFQFFAAVPAILQIMQDLWQRHPEIAFLWVGEGPAGAVLRQQVAEVGLTAASRFVGTVPHDQVPRYLSLMDVVFSPYRGDYLFYGSSMKLLEYMAAGKAVVATALGQIKELVHDGYNGLLYEPEDWTTLAAKLEALLTDPGLRQRLGQNARQTILQGWTWAQQAEKLAQLLATAVATP